LERPGTSPLSGTFPAREFSMKRALVLLTFALSLSAVRPVQAAELKILEPTDRSVVKGAVTFKVKPEHAPGEQFFQNVDIRIQNEFGTTLQKLVAVFDRRTGICAVPFDTRRLRDGMYTAVISYRTLVGDKAQPVEEDLVFGVRNGTTKPVKFTVELEEREFGDEEGADIVVKVLDSRGKPMTGARVAFKVDKGETSSDAEITDTEGEAFVTVDSDEVGSVTLTITVEGLPPVTKVIRFV
jgi:hypothetical protein